MKKKSKTRLGRKEPPTPPAISLLPKPWKKVCIIWDDAHSNTNWFDEEEIVEWMNDERSWLCEEVGYLIAKTNEEVFIAARMCLRTGQVGMVQRVPRGWVREYAELHGKDVKRLIKGRK
jgi:hypothetical protein